MGADRAALFAVERPRLVGLAYRMLGSVADAEDVVSEAWLRYDAAEGVERPAAWLTTVTSRLAIDRWRAQARRREDYVGPWLPEPVLTATPTGGGGAPGAPADPQDAVELAESLTLGFLVVLDRLGPVERAVFLLADVFAVPYAEIAEAVDRSPEACRQVASRARHKLREARTAAAAADEALLAELVGAMVAGDPGRLVELLAPGVVLTSDGGPLRRAARHPVVGPDRVARFLCNLAGRTPPEVDVALVEVNGGAGLVLRAPGVRRGAHRRRRRRRADRRRAAAAQPRQVPGGRRPPGAVLTAAPGRLSSAGRARCRPAG